MLEKMSNVFDINSFKKKYAFCVKPALILLGVYLVGISAIIRANFNYIDDMGRTAKGYQQWDVCSRYISSFLSNFIHGDSYLTDVSPLPQFLAIIVLVLSSIIVLYLVSEKKEFCLWQLVGIIPLGMSPYFLECMSYKYDSPYMALSIFASVASVLLRKKSIIVYGLASMIGIIGVCTTYQPALGIFPMLIILLSMKDWNEAKEVKEIIKFIITSVVGYGLGLVIFKIFLMKPTDSYVSSAMPEIKDIIPTIVKNEEKINELMRKLEVFYLANKSENMYFAMCFYCGSR